MRKSALIDYTAVLCCTNSMLTLKHSRKQDLEMLVLSKRPIIPSFDKVKAVKKIICMVSVSL